MRACNVLFFDGMCDEVIEGYRYVPKGETWEVEDGMRFEGELICPWRSYYAMRELQGAVDRMQTAADEELAALIEEIYNEDLEVINNV